MPRLPKRTIINAPITQAGYADVLEEILHLAQSKRSAYICIANVHMVIEAYLNPAFNRVLEEATIATPDGKPVSVFMNLLYGTCQDRIAGPDLMVDLFKNAAEQGLSVYFYGSTPDVLQHLQEKLRQDFPTLHVAGAFSPPFRELSETEDAEIVEQINQSGCHIVFVALGCPKQEKWMHAHIDKIQAVMIGVGAAFPFYTGHLKRAPRWMQSASLEWLYRLYKEPRRLFKRYFVSNSLFLILIVKQLAHQWIKRVP